VAISRNSTDTQLLTKEDEDKYWSDNDCVQNPEHDIDIFHPHTGNPRRDAEDEGSANKVAGYC
jgi:hypothetical protein